MEKNYPPDWTYADFAGQFRAELFGQDSNESDKERWSMFAYFIFRSERMDGSARCVRCQVRLRALFLRAAAAAA